MTPVHEGMDVRSQNYAADARDMPDTSRSPIKLHEPSILIVGAGPAGLSAARAAAFAGARPMVLDERSTPGGQYFKQLVGSHTVTNVRALDRQMRDGAELIAQVERLGVPIWRGATIWGAFGPQEIAVFASGQQHLFVPQRLVVATGAYERSVPVPGWTLPGYMTTGAAQTLMRAYRVLPGRRVIVAGNGPLNLQLASALVKSGANVVAVVESARSPWHRAPTHVLRAAFAVPRLIAEGLRYLAHLRLARVPVLYGSAVSAVDGDRHVESCTVVRIDADGHAVPGSETHFQVDCVCAGYGFLPSNEIARMLGCRHGVDDAHGTLRTLTDDEGLTTVPGVYAIGDGALFRGAHAARAQGHITGYAAARSLGHPTTPQLQQLCRAARRSVRRHLAFQQALWHMFDAPPIRCNFATPETTLCRCEGVSRQAVDTAMDCGAASLGALKRRTRLGMGPCQGRCCQSLVAPLFADREDSISDELNAFAPAAPIKPLRVGDMV